MKVLKVEISTEDVIHGSVFEGTLVECRRYVMEVANAAVEKELSVAVLSGGEVFGQARISNPDGTSEVVFTITH